MKKITCSLISVLLLLTTSCVQKAYKKTAVITLTVSNMKDIKTVGIRGNGKPLSWEQDVELKELVKDSLYTANITTVTGYKFAEIKFTVNGEFELKDKPNRRVQFADADTTFYNATFNIVQ
jgi:putative oxidoreductase